MAQGEDVSECVPVGWSISIILTLNSFIYHKNKQKAICGTKPSLNTLEYTIRSNLDCSINVSNTVKVFFA